MKAQITAAPWSLLVCTQTSASLSLGGWGGVGHVLAAESGGQSVLGIFSLHRRKKVV